jgi:biopolymer transport protein ExbD
MNIRKTLRQQPEVHTSALNDVLFILLFFFLIIATLANPNVIKLMNPKANSDTKAKQTVVVSIDDQQRLYVGTQPANEQDLQLLIQEAIAKSTDAEPTVVINADKLATADNIVAVMRAAHTLKVKAVLAVEKPQQ